MEVVGIVGWVVDGGDNTGWGSLITMLQRASHLTWKISLLGPGRVP